MFFLIAAILVGRSPDDRQFAVAPGTRVCLP